MPFLAWMKFKKENNEGKWWINGDRGKLQFEC